MCFIPYVSGAPEPEAAELLEAEEIVVLKTGIATKGKKLICFK